MVNKNAQLKNELLTRSSMAKISSAIFHSKHSLWQQLVDGCAFSRRPNVCPWILSADWTALPCPTFKTGVHQTKSHLILKWDPWNFLRITAHIYKSQNILIRYFYYIYICSSYIYIYVNLSLGLISETLQILIAFAGRWNEQQRCAVQHKRDIFDSQAVVLTRDLDHDQCHGESNGKEHGQSNGKCNYTRFGTYHLIYKPKNQYCALRFHV